MYTAKDLVVMREQKVNHCVNIAINFLLPSLWEHFVAQCKTTDFVATLSADVSSEEMVKKVCEYLVSFGYRVVVDIKDRKCAYTIGIVETL